MKPLIEGSSKWKGPKGALTIVGNVGVKTGLNEQHFHTEQNVTVIFYIPMAMKNFMITTVIQENGKI